ncbi:MATE family efflux transporter [Kordiimonas sediminis]|uniref:MATE family efflux transporter n=1 Tax=Kordiimonas sediminis TaxID=1735581 RepID=A0A919ANE4_9PROT|nr:MATE family efflux transporter [Kordiimonas sediminis]GHF15731.1 MATE family efflux transporter [Kordiimonas sediminis]
MTLTHQTQTPPESIVADKAIWAIAGPAIIANSSAPLVGLVDTWVIGHLPDASHLAAVGTGATIFSFVFWMFGFLRMGTTGAIAQAHGAKDTRLISHHLIRSFALALCLGIGCILLQYGIFAFAVFALAPPESVMSALSAYFDIRILAAPATLLIYVLNGYLIGIARARASLVLQLVLNITNGLLNLFFVLAMGMGVAGIALGTVIAEYLAVGLGFLFIARYHGFSLLADAWRSKGIFVFKKMQALLSVNMWLFLRTLVLLTCMSLITRLAAGLGEVALAASHIMNVFMMLMSLGLDGFAYAAEALSGAAYGAKNRALFHFWSVRTSVWAVLTSLAYGVIFWVFGADIVEQLTSLPAVQASMSTLIPLLSVMPIIAVACYQFDGIFIGATRARPMFITMLAAMGVFALSTALLYAPYGLVGIWGGFAVFLIARGVGLWLYYPGLKAGIADKAPTTNTA